MGNFLWIFQVFFRRAASIKHFWSAASVFPVFPEITSVTSAGGYVVKKYEFFYNLEK